MTASVLACLMISLPSILMTAFQMVYCPNLPGISWKPSIATAPPAAAFWAAAAGIRPHTSTFGGRGGIVIVEKSIVTVYNKILNCAGVTGDPGKSGFAEDDSMPEIIAAMIELVIFLCALWFLSFLSTLLHELGHALGYMLATGDGHWHIRVGWGKRLLNTKALTVNLLVFDGFFTPSEKKIDTKAKLITTLSGGPAASLLLFLGLLFLRFGGFSFQSDILADGVIESFLNIALFS